MSGPLEHRNLLLELVHLLLGGFGNVEVLDGNLPVPVAPVNFAEVPRPQAVPHLYAFEGDAPFIHDTIPVLLRGRKNGREREIRENLTNCINNTNLITPLTAVKANVNLQQTAKKKKKKLVK